MKTKFFPLLLAAALLLTACQTQTPGTETVPAPPPEVQEPQGTPTTEAENLVKLCKVWGVHQVYAPGIPAGAEGLG